VKDRKGLEAGSLPRPLFPVAHNLVLRQEQVALGRLRRQVVDIPVLAVDSYHRQAAGHHSLHHPVVVLLGLHLLRPQIRTPGQRMHVSSCQLEQEAVRGRWVA
jgi:hypothetical protein